jgi:hypothetical protein
MDVRPNSQKMLRVLPDHFTGHAAQEGASRGGFTLGFPKVWLKPAEAVSWLSHAKWNVRFGSLADILTSPRHVRFSSNNGHWAAHSNQHLAVGL